MAGKTNEDYWNTSSNVSFNFEDDYEVQNSGTAFDSLIAHDIFSLNLEDEATLQVLPIHSLITKRNLDSVLDDVKVPTNASVPDVQETVLKMFLGMPYTLYLYRSLDHKLQLLDEAVAIEDGNIILTVLLYLKKTLKYSILLNQLLNRKVALQHYINYLMQDQKLEDLSDVYMATGNMYDIVYLFYLGCKDTSNNNNLHTKLLRFLAEHQSNLNLDNSMMFMDFKNFIKWQLGANVATNSVIEQLAALYSLESEKKLYENSNIMSFKQQFKVNDFQYEWIQLNALSALQMWSRLVERFIKPNWLTKRNSIKSNIDSELFITTLYKHNPPKATLMEFLSSISDNELSLDLAIRFGCYKFVVDTYANQRDRLAILNYKDRIPRQMEEFMYAESVLRLSDKKWKN